MRIMFKVNTKWESGTYICEVDKIEFFDDSKDLRFIFNNGVMDLLCKIIIKNEKEYKTAKDELFLTGKYDFSNFEVHIRKIDGEECDWVCVNFKKEEENEGI